jgi:hypothetical protein
MQKTIYSLPALRELLEAANRRYLELRKRSPRTFSMIAILGWMRLTASRKTGNPSRESLLPRW